jgi:hypothetical protein
LVASPKKSSATKSWASGGAVQNRERSERDQDATFYGRILLLAERRFLIPLATARGSVTSLIVDRLFGQSGAWLIQDRAKHCVNIK